MTKDEVHTRIGELGPAIGTNQLNLGRETSETLGSRASRANERL